VEVIKELIINFHKKGIPEYIPREIEIPDEKGLVKVITGPRRAGKTYFLYQIMDSLKEPITRYVYLDFEDYRLMDLRNLEEIVSAYYSLYPDQEPIFFFDEIQNAPNWERFIRRLLNDGYEVYITGSNSNLLSGEFSTVLAGRYWEITILPLSFREYLRFKGVTNFPYVPEKYHLVDDYLYYGGFPGVVNSNRKEELLRLYFQSTILQDVVKRYDIREEALLELLIKKLAENIGKEYSFLSISKKLKSLNISISPKSLINYYKYLENAWLFLTSYREKQSFLKKEMYRKSYFIDNGYLSLFQDGWGKLLENAVAVELFRKYKRLHYWRAENAEVDFITPSHAIQVSYNLGDNLERELKSLRHYLDLNPDKKGIIITYNQEQSFGEIEAIPFWKLSQQ